MATIRVFLDYKMRCVGCPIAGFHSLAEACRDHWLSSEDVLATLEAAVAGDAKACREPASYLNARAVACGERA